MGTGPLSVSGIRTTGAADYSARITEAAWLVPRYARYIGFLALPKVCGGELTTTFSRSTSLCGRDLVAFGSVDPGPDGDSPGLADRRLI